MGVGVVNFLTVVTFERLSRGTEHFAFLQGVGLCCSGIGMAVSATLCGILIDQVGFASAFATLGAIGCVPVALTSCLTGAHITANDPEAVARVQARATGPHPARPPDQRAMPDTWPVAVARVQWTFMTFCLLCGSCTAMITAWYAHLKLK